MHIRTSTVRRGRKKYTYKQLVQSYRRKSDGMPAHKVLANVSHLTEAELLNLRITLEANRLGKRVVVAPAPLKPARPTANLQYLDLAVLLELWKEWGLDDLFDELIPAGEATVRPSDVIASLAFHRCVDPGSKLHAQRWFPTTALPELLHIPPDQFNNTRIHRVLEQLDKATPSLIAKLPSRYLEQDGPFTVLYVDLTDAVFVGEGPELATKGRTKRGTFERKVGIVLACNSKGYPLLWRVVAGKTAECHALREAFSALSREPWAKRTPVVCDRAMGSTADVQELLATGMHFVTAMRRTEFPTYAGKASFADFKTVVAEGKTDEDLRKAGVEAALAAGFTKISDTLYVRDLGIVEPVLTPLARPTRASGHRDRCGEALRVAMAAERAVAAGEVASYNGFARQAGISKSLLKKYRSFLRLPDTVIQRILDGQAANLALEPLRQLLKLDATAAQRQFEETLNRAGRRPELPTPAMASELPVVRVRSVVYFNPDMFVEQRKKAIRRRKQVAKFVKNLNAQLASPKSRMTRDQIVARVDRRLRKDNLLELHEVDIHKVSDASHYQVSISLKSAEYERRIRYAGLSVLVANPTMKQAASSLVKHYRHKDTVEKDFQVMKSVLRMLPVRHHTDAKVRAHVTLCVIALLLERTLRNRIGDQCTATAALEIWSDCRLNHYAPTGDNQLSVYLLNHTTDDQRRLVDTLQLQRVLDEAELGERIRHR